ncbi:MAG: hypothetical protein Q8S54_02460 [Bacteroidota bacterium]|nr:hypothetical protein [Odoribacter sp.]MDP3642034.1 hypothetical protein [Bacteroidota bacterium]
MKKTLLKSFSVFLAMLMFSMQTFAYTSKSSTSITKDDIQSVTQFDESEIYAAFADVSDLDQYLTQNDGKTYTDISQENASLLSGISSTATLPYSASSDELVMGIPSFLWGCVFGWVGLLVVYLVLENKDQTKKALKGCVVSTVVGIVFYVVVIAAAATTTTYTY